MTNNSSQYFDVIWDVAKPPSYCVYDDAIVEVQIFIDNKFIGPVFFAICEEDDYEVTEVYVVSGDKQWEYTVEHNEAASEMILQEVKHLATIDPTPPSGEGDCLQGEVVGVY